MESEPSTSHETNRSETVEITTGCPKKNLRCLISCKVKTIKAITLK